ncbi:MAG: DUF4350 domain-containing protein [Myxococcota bacterium]
MRFFGAAGLVMILSGLGAYYVTGTGELSVFSILNLAAGLLMILTGAVIELRRFQGFSGVRSRRVVLHWSMIGTVVLLVVIGANVLAQRWLAMIDLTEQRLYSLSDQTLRACESLEQEGRAGRTRLLLLEDALLAREVHLLLQAYRAACPAVEVETIRTADAPADARHVLQTMEVTVLACRPGRCEGAGFPTEENITNALVRLGRQRRIEVHFLVGHGEANLASPSALGYSQLTASLRNEGLQLEALVGPARVGVPASAAVLIAAAPERDLLEPEIQAIEHYLEGGGRLLALLEPERRTNLEALLARWGFDLPPGVIVDRATSPLLEDPEPVTLLVTRFDPFHPVTRRLSRRTLLLMPGVRAIDLARKPQPDDRLTRLAYSSPGAWLEQDVDSALTDRAIEADSGERRGSELPLAAAGRYPRGDREARIVVMGDHDFASNRLLGDLYNRDFVLNAVLWLAEDEERIAIRPKLWTPDQDPLTLQQTLAYFYFLAFALPELLLLLGIHAWYRQRSG